MNNKKANRSSSYRTAPVYYLIGKLNGIIIVVVCAVATAIDKCTYLGRIL